MARKEVRKTPSQIRFDTIYHAIRQRICLGHYPPGAALFEAELAEEFKVSRTPVRRVLTRLESEGLIESRHGAGTFVTSIDFEALAEAYQFRMALAALAGELSPRQPDAAFLERMEALLAECEAEKRAGSLERFGLLNMTFSQMCFQLIGNGPLRRISEQLYFLTSRIMLQLTPPDKLEPEFDFFILEIREVLAALRIADMPAFGYIRRAHLSMNVSRLMLYKQEQG
jgi:DNA-binding GntR family transcriptional regulator